MEIKAVVKVQIQVFEDWFGEFLVSLWDEISPDLNEKIQFSLQSIVEWNA